VGKGEVRHVEVVFDFPAVAGLKAHRRSDDVGPVGIFKFGHFGQRSGFVLGEAHPDHSVALLNGEILQMREFKLVGRRVHQGWNVQTLASAVKPPAVVSTLQAAIANMALAEVVAFVRAGIPRGEERTVGKTGDDEGLSQERGAGDFSHRKVGGVYHRLPSGAEDLKRQFFGERGGFGGHGVDRVGAPACRRGFAGTRKCHLQIGQNIGENIRGEVPKKSHQPPG
jgi:hypothetical protein